MLYNSNSQAGKKQTNKQKKNYLDGESKVKKKTAYKQIEKDELKVDLSG